MSLVDQLLENDEVDAKAWIMKRFAPPRHHLVQHDAGLWEVMKPTVEERNDQTYGWIHNNGHTYLRPEDRRVQPVLYSCYRHWRGSAGVDKIGDAEHFQTAVRMCIEDWLKQQTDH